MMIVNKMLKKIKILMLIKIYNLTLVKILLIHHFKFQMMCKILLKKISNKYNNNKIKIKFKMRFNK